MTLHEYITQSYIMYCGGGGGGGEHYKGVYVQLVHYQRMHVVSKVSKRFPISVWEISCMPWKLCAFSDSVQVVHSMRWKGVNMM